MRKCDNEWKPLYVLRKTATEDHVRLAALARKRLTAQHFLVRQVGMRTVDLVNVPTRLLVDLCRMAKRYGMTPALIPREDS